MLTQRIKEYRALKRDDPDYSRSNNWQITILQSKNADAYKTVVASDFMEAAGLVSFTRMSATVGDRIPLKNTPFFYESPVYNETTNTGFIQNGQYGRFSSCSAEGIANAELFNKDLNDLFTFYSYNSIPAADKTALQKLFPITFKANTNKPGILRINHNRVYNVDHTFWFNTKAKQANKLCLSKDTSILNNEESIIIKLVAKIPRSLKLMIINNNSYSATHQDYYLWAGSSTAKKRRDPIIGTGNWETYTIELETSGTFDKGLLEVNAPEIVVQPISGAATNSDCWYLAYASCIAVKTLPTSLNSFAKNYSPYENTTMIQNGYILSNRFIEADANTSNQNNKYLGQEPIVLKKI